MNQGLLPGLLPCLQGHVLRSSEDSSYFADITPAGSLQVPDFELPPVQVSLVEQGRL